MKETLRLVSPRDRVLYLRSLSGFDGLSTRDLRRIAQLMTEVFFEKGEVIYATGAPLDAAFFLVEGSVEFTRNGLKVGRMKAPSPIGFVGVLGGLEAMIGVITAVDDCVALRVSRAAIVQVWEASAPVFHNSLKLAAMRVYQGRGRWPYKPNSSPPADVGEMPSSPATLIGRIQALRETGPFRSSNVEPIVEIAKQQVEVRYQAGEALWEEGDIASYFVRIRYGQVAVTQRGRPEPGLVGSEYSIGLFESIGGAPRGYTAIAATEVVLIRSEVETLLNVLEDHFSLGMALLRSFSRLVIDDIWKMDDLTFLAS